uniref:SBP-type domain-containing protein n=1 Tax=Ananas comosus var. bracteatus TaxID=296719 RepID=A0A6V7NU22_ANACO|nr:unnamed protein product [Ananas comosus var. bracteatus]
MEAKIGSGSHLLSGTGRKSFEWDLNDWKWDGELFVATPVNGVPPSVANGAPLICSSSCLRETDLGIGGKGKGEVEKRRRIVPVEEGEPLDGDGSLSLKLGWNAYPAGEADIAKSEEEESGKKTKLPGSTSNGPVCQVEGCAADLSRSRDYHRRHKVCEMHAKASTAVVRNAIQRFCQQCSRFHLLQEFDEGKRSCRRRLVGHNRRRRKTHPDSTSGGASLIDDKSSSYLLISLLRALSNMHSNNFDRTEDQDQLSHLLRNLATLAGSFDTRNLSGLLQPSQSQLPLGASSGMSLEATNMVPDSSPASESTGPMCPPSKITCVNGGQGPQISENFLSDAVPKDCSHPTTNTMTNSPESTACRVRLNDFDLNNAYNDIQDCGVGCEKSIIPSCAENSSPNYLSQTSGNSDSISTQSLSSSNGDAQYQTDRIVFKLFGKYPHDLPLVLRTQILDWLSNSPTNIESYIRPGCVILTVYLRLSEPLWQELCDYLSSYLDRLLNSSTNNFWRSGWMYVKVRHQIAFIYNGQVVLDVPLPLGCPDNSGILCVKPVAVPHSTTADFTVKVFSLARSTTRLFCSFEGKYLVQKMTVVLTEESVADSEHEELVCLSFCCSLPDASGRGFIEVEDRGLSNSFFPFIVTDQEVCSEIRTLETVIEIATNNNDSQGREDEENSRNLAINFLNELGWLLRMHFLMSRLEKVEFHREAFHLSRFSWLISFAMEHDWCAVMKKLLDILFSGTIDLGARSPREIALSENLLHRAAGRCCRDMVELLLKYTPEKSLKESSNERLLFRPDFLGPENITPLHIAAAGRGSESIVDALTDDSEMVGINAWRNVRDSVGYTPEDYARMRGHESYIQLVQKKLNTKIGKHYFVVNIHSDNHPKYTDADKPFKPAFGIAKSKLMRSSQKPCCNLCSRQLMAYHNSMARTLLYRPAMLAMVGVATVCVCVGILFKTMPEVFFVSPSFRWELLGYGST